MSTIEIFKFVDILDEKLEKDSRQYKQLDRPEGAINYAVCYGGMSGYMKCFLTMLNLTDDQKQIMYKEMQRLSNER